MALILLKDDLIDYEDSTKAIELSNQFQTLVQEVHFSMEKNDTDSARGPDKPQIW